MNVYLTGSLRNPTIPALAAKLRAVGHSVFDDWHCAGPRADDHWQSYEQARGRTYPEALDGHAAWHTFDYDRVHIKVCDALVLVMPAGKSSHLEAGYAKGIGKLVYVLFTEGYPERWDVMYRFADKVVDSVPALLAELLDAQEELAA